MSTVQGEDIYGSIQDDFNDARDAADNAYHIGKDIYNASRHLHDSDAEKNGKDGVEQDAGSVSSSSQGRSAGSGNGASPAENLYGADDAAAAENGEAVAAGSVGNTAAEAGKGAGGVAAGGATGVAAGGAGESGGTAAAGAAAGAGGAAAGEAAAGGATGAAGGAAAGGGTAAGVAAGGWIIIVIICVLVVIFLFVALIASMQEEGQGSAGVRYTASQHNQIRGNYSGQFEEGNNDDRPDDDPDYNELQSYQGISPYMKAYCQFIPFMKGSEQFVNSIRGDDLLEGTVKEMKEEKGFAETAGVFEKAKKLALLDGKDWIQELERSNPLGDWNEVSSDLTMGRLESATNGLFDDIDYAELIDVLSQNEEYDLTSMTEKDFRSVFLGNRSNRTQILRKYYYLHIEPRKSTYGKEGVATIRYDEEGNVIYDNSDDPLDVGDVTLEKYNLDELYTICAGPDAGWEKNDFNPDAIDSKSKRMTNEQKLNWMENYTREYGGFNITSGSWNRATATKLFGDRNRSGRGEIRERRGFDHADFSYWVSETLDDIFSTLHGLFKHEDSATTGGGYIENKKNKKILDMYRYINQGEEPQASLPFAGGTFQQYGCAPSSYIMVIEYFLRQQVDIESAIRKFSAGTAGIRGGAMINAYGGTSGQSSYSDAGQIISQIDAGKPVILSVRGYNSFHHTSGGHYLVIMGYDEEGFYMYDPGDRSNTYGFGTQTCAVTYEQFEKDASTFQAVYTFDFPNVTIPEFSESTTGGYSVTFDVDEETVTKVENALSMHFMGGTKAYAMEYALLTQKYGSNFAIGFMANMCQESRGTGGLDQKTGKTFTSGADIQAYIENNASWSGLGIHQWTASRKQGLLNQYKEDGLLEKSSVSQEDLIASELNYLMKELNGAESGVIQKCEGKSASECATIIAKEFERCGIDGGRAKNANTMYNDLQRNGLLD